MFFLSRPLSFAIILICGASSAYAAGIPSAADPSRQIIPETKKIDDFKGLTPATRNVPPPTNFAPKDAQYQFFSLKSVHITGMTAYAEQDIQNIYAADIGQKISVERLYDILNNLQQRYLDDGYSLTRVSLPDQDLKDGNISIQVIEGYAADVEIDPAFVSSSVVLDDAAAQIAAMRPLNTKKLERILLLLNELADLDVSAILGTPPKGTAEGGIRLILKRNEESRTGGSVAVNNHGSVFSGPFQTVANIRTASVLTPFDDVGLATSITMPTSEMKYIGVKYHRPILGARGLSVTFEASGGQTVPGENLKELDVRGKTHSFRSTLSYAVIKQRDEDLKLNASLEIRNSKTNLFGSRLYDDRLRVASIGLNYHHADAYDGMNAAEVTYSQGINALGARKTGSEDLSRDEGRSDFKKIYASVGRLQTLPFRFEFLTAILGQYAFDPLLSSEEFGFGGSQYGRGYDPSEITGDKGFAATFELRRSIPYGGENITLQGYVFFDFGKIWNIDPNSKNKMSAASTGLGLRVASRNGWSCDMNVAIPLTRPASNPPQYANKQSPRFLLSLQKVF